MNVGGLSNSFAAPGEFFDLEAAGRAWRLARLGNLEDLWNAMGEDNFDEDHIPYWTELWPSSMALASWLAMRQNEIRDQLCLEIGCGLGFTALVANWLGAKVVGMDNEMEALKYCRLNAVMNKVEKARWIATDWRKPAFRPKIFRFIWGSDILYEKRFMQPVANLLGRLLSPEGAAWFAEPGRRIFDAFLAEIDDRGWSMRQVFTLPIRGFALAGERAQARVWEVRMGAGAGA